MMIQEEEYEKGDVLKCVLLRPIFIWYDEYSKSNSSIIRFTYR